MQTTRWSEAEPGAQWCSNRIIRKRWWSEQRVADTLMTSHWNRRMWISNWTCQVSVFAFKTLRTLAFYWIHCFFLSLTFRSTNRHAAIPGHSILLLWLHWRNFDCVRIKPGSRAHSNPLGESCLWRPNAKFHGFCCTRRNFDHHFLLIRCPDLWRDVDRTQWGHAWKVFGVRHHRHRDPILARRYPVRDYVRPNHVRLNFQLLNIRIDTSRQHRLGHFAHHSHWTVWNVFRWVVEIVPRMHDASNRH